MRSGSSQKEPLLPRVADAWASGCGAFIVLAIFTCLVITAAGGWRWFTGWLNSLNAAGWVQAVGAIGAIFGSAWIGRAQARYQYGLNEQAAREIASGEQKQAIVAWLAVSSLTDGLAMQIQMQLALPEMVGNEALLLEPFCTGLQHVEQSLLTLPLVILPTNLIAEFLSVVTAATDLRFQLEAFKRPNRDAKARALLDGRLRVMRLLHQRLVGLAKPHL